MPGRDSFPIGGEEVRPGKRATVNLPVSVLSDHTPVSMSVHVVHGRKPGPVLFVSAAVHGDEIIGVEIVRRLLRAKHLDRLKGTLLVIPVVNSFGFLNRSRYLPDRRDLNRSFPGSQSGSLASRLAHLFMQQVVARSDVGIDLHSAAVHRSNLPQIRVSSSRPETMQLAKAFGAPLILTSKIREGSLRHAAQLKDVDILVFEAGEGLRFDELAVRTGLAGILRVMRHLGMVAARGVPKIGTQSILSRSSYWVRAAAGGMMRTFKTNGDQVAPGDILGIISDPFGEIESEIVVSEGGLVIGRSKLPVINEGDGAFHIARIQKENAEAVIDSLTTQLEDEAMFDEDEII